MADIFDGIEPMVYKSKIRVPYSWWAGDTASVFLTSLRDRKVIQGKKCAQCNKVYVPPRKACPACFKETEWVAVSDTGTVLSYTVVRKKLAALPKDPPVIYGLIKLDGADTAMLHFLGDVVPEKLAVGMRVKAKFSEQRSATIRDIEYFAPIP